MTTNPFAYYEDESLPRNAKSLNVSSDGEALSDMEPRYPIVLMGNFVAFLRPAVKTYRIEVNANLFECRLPNGEFIEWPRGEARKRVEISGNNIHLHLPDGNVYCFKRFNRHHDLAFARLKTWLMPTIDDAEKAYEQVRQQLQKTYLNVWFFTGIVIYCVFLGYFTTGTFFHPPRVPGGDPLTVFWGQMTIIPARLLCIVMFAALIGVKGVTGKFLSPLLLFACFLGIMISACSFMMSLIFGVIFYYPGSIFF